MPLIKESFLLAASDADILAAPSRLAAIPRNGLLTIEASCTDADPTNFAQLTLQLPGGDNPFIDLMIPAGGQVNGGEDVVLDKNTKFMVVMRVAQGGHVGLAYVEAGTVASLFLHVSLKF